MALEIDLQEVENATKQLLDGRMDSVRNLAKARAHVGAEQDELRVAETSDRRRTTRRSRPAGPPTSSARSDLAA